MFCEYTLQGQDFVDVNFQRVSSAIEEFEKDMEELLFSELKWSSTTLWRSFSAGGRVAPHSIQHVSYVRVDHAYLTGKFSMNSPQGQSYSNSRRNN